MDLYFLDNQFKPLAIVDNYESFIWTRRYCRLGEFVLYATPSIYPKIKNAKYLYIGDNKELALVEFFEITDNRKLLVRGEFYDKKYDRKIIYGTHIFRNKYPEEIIYSLMGEYFPSITLPSNIGSYGSRVTTQFTGDTVLEAIEALCKTYYLGYKTTFSNQTGNLSFRVYQGLNRTSGQSANSFVVFSEDFGTIEDSVYTWDIRDELNYALVAGEGEGEARKTATVDWSGGGERKELFVDARDLKQEEGVSDSDYTKILQERGEEKLSLYQKIENVEVTPVVNNLVYQTDYDLGDVCSVNIDQKDEYTQEKILQIEVDQRIEQIDEVYEGGGFSLKASLGEQYPTVGDLLEKVE